MDVAPPPASPTRFQEVDDRLVVSFRPKRRGLVFLSVWLAGWTFFGVLAAAALTKADRGEAAFLLFWLCGWFFGECSAAGAIAWLLFGRESLSVTSAELVDRKEIGRLARTKSYDALRVGGIRGEPVPHGEDESPRKDFCLRLSYDGEVVRIGEGMGEREAVYIASIVFARIRPRSWWSDEGDARPQSISVSSSSPQPVLEAGRFRVPQPSSNQAWLLAGVMTACVVLAGSLLVAVFGEDAGPRPVPRRQALSLPPSRENFTSARKYAEAMTSYLLASGTTKLLGHPRCGARVTWRHWSCHAPAKSTIGPFVGRTLRYRCATADTGSGWICGPDPPIGPTAPTIADEAGP